MVAILSEMGTTLSMSLDRAQRSMQERRLLKVRLMPPGSQMQGAAGE
ncbi:hypothetical protein [Achromobacter piechaudii]